MTSEIEGYIRENRDRYTREAITAQLVAAGHDPATVEATWATVNADLAPAEPERPKYLPIMAALIGVGAIGAFIAGSDRTFFGPFWGVSYLVSTPVVVMVGIFLTWLIDRGLGLAVIALSAIGVVIFTVGSPSPLNLGTGISAAVLVAAAVRYERPRRPNLAAWALPVVAWLATTGICISPLFLPGL